MPVDRHGFWRRCKYKLRALEERAPEGYAPVVKVFLPGREDSIEIGVVDTSRKARDHGTWLQASSAADIAMHL